VAEGRELGEQRTARPEDLTGVDLLPARIAEARSRCPAGVRLQTGSATALAFGDGTFDIVMEIRRLFPSRTVTLRRRSLAPPIARAIAPRSSLLCRLLGAVPLLCTHYVGSIRPGA
jgi:hypothetical protein